MQIHTFYPRPRKINSLASLITKIGLPALVLIAYINNSFLPGLPSLVILIIPIIILLHLARLLLSGRASKRSIPLYISLTILPLLGYSTISSLWAFDLNNALRYTYFLVIGPGLILILPSYIKSEKNITSFINIIALLTTLEIVLGMIEIQTGIHAGNSRHYSPDFYYVNQFIPTGTFYNENNYSIALALGIPFIFIKFLDTSTFFIRTFFLVLLIFAIWLIIKTENRLALAAITISFISFIALKYQAKNIIMLIITALLLTLSLVLFPSFYDGFLKLLSEKIGTDLLQNEDSVDLIRLHLINISINAMKESPILGLGAGGFDLYCNEVGSDLLRNICAPHNWIFEIGANFGLIPATLQVMFTVILFIKYVEKHKKIKHFKLKRIYLSFGSIFPVILISGISLSSILQFTLTWIFLSYFVALINLELNEK